MAGNWWDDEEVQSAKPEYKEGAGRFAPKDIPGKNWWDDEEKPKILTPEENKKLEKQLNAKSKFDKYNFMKNWGLGGQTMEDIVSPSLVKGIPMAGNAVPQTEALSQFEGAHPWASKGLQAAGAVGSTLPLAGAAAAKAGGGFFNQLMGQTAVNAPLNAADLIARKGTDATAKEGAGALGMGVVSSVLPAGMTATIGQAPRTGYPWDRLKNYVETLKGQKGDFFGKGSAPLPPGAPPPWALTRAGTPSPRSTIFPGGAPKLPDPEWATKAGTKIPGSQIEGAGHNLSTVAGALAGGMLAGDPMMGTAIGALAGRQALHPLLNHFLESGAGRVVDKFAHHPSTQDILRALAGHTGRQMAPNLNVF
jgi:hypothetical protein